MKSTLFARLAAPAVLVAGAAYLAQARPMKRQSYQTHNLTPDGYWHNRYHMLLSMAVYGDYNTLCPNETFTQASMIANFPNSTRPPWDVISTFGPTPSGARGFTTIVPEMNKALIVFQGDYALEQTLPLDTMYWNETLANSSTTTSVLPARCTGCTVNKFAWDGYLEAKIATNNFATLREAYYGQDLVFSITGHGLGGMHSQIAAIDLYEEQIDYYNHAYGSPRVFNDLGSTWYADRFDGEAGERGIANNDQYTEFIPESTNYSHSGTPFYYYGYNNTALGMNWEICWLEDSPDYSACMPRDQGLGTTPLQDHYFYFTPVTDCGKIYQMDTSPIDAFLATVNGTSGFATTASITTAASTSSSSVAPTSSAPPATTSAPADAQPTTTTGGAATLASISLVTLLAGAVLPSLLL